MLQAYDSTIESGRPMNGCHSDRYRDRPALRPISQQTRLCSAMIHRLTTRSANARGQQFI